MSSHSVGAYLREPRDADVLVDRHGRVVGAELLEADRAVREQAAQQAVRVAHVCDDEQVALQKSDDGGGGAAVDGLPVALKQEAVLGLRERRAEPLIPGWARARG